MILTLLLVSFCLLLSFCVVEAAFILKLISRLKRHRRYVIEFMTIQNEQGVSIEAYLTRKLLPKYLIGLGLVGIFVIGLNLVPVSLMYKVGGTLLGILSCAWARTFNRKFLTLLWEKVLVKS